MEQIEFLELPQALKLVELLSKGTFLDFIIKGVYMVKLFQMKNYYIETYYHIEKNRFDSIITFDDTDKLTPYLKKIKLDIYPTPPPPPEKNIHSKGFEHIL
jgi:hypothetical protein